MMAAVLRLESLNCKGLGSPAKRRQIMEHFKNKRCDIILLQETHATIQSERKYSREWKRMDPNHDSVWCSYSNRSCGVAVLLKDKKTTKLLDTRVDAEGRVATLQLEIGDRKIQVQCVYAPTAHEMRPEFFENLDMYTFPDCPAIVGGDFNMVEKPDMDRLGGTPSSNHMRGLSQLGAFKKLVHVVDLWREKYPAIKTYTFSTPDNKVHSRLDRFYVSSKFRQKFVEQLHLHNPWSDHRTVSLMLDISSKPDDRGKGYWKLNVSLLDNEEFCSCITDTIAAWEEKRPSYDSIQQWWNELKLEIKLTATQLSVRFHKDRQQKIRKLIKLRDRENDVTMPNKEYIATTDLEISQLKDVRHKGAMIRSREKLLISGEKPTRYFYAQERIKKAKSTIHKLRVIDEGAGPVPCPSRAIDGCPGLCTHPCPSSAPPQEKHTRITCDSGEILSEVHKYYSSLFEKQSLDLDLQEELLSNIDRKLPDADRSKMDAPINQKELWDAVKQSNRDKSPGLDGLPIEFYSAFWGVLAKPFLDVANDWYLNGIEAGAQQRISLITLIQKKGDLLDLDNWRPISLLCVDYKILSKALSIRLKTVLPSIIMEEQTCGILGRTIFENLYQVRDTIDYTRDHEIKAYLISLDFRKAFDSVDHDFLLKTLTAFGFGPRYRDFIHTTLLNCVAMGMNGGRFTKPIALGRGVKQGDQESMQLYDLIGEVLAVQIRKNRKIRGIKLPSRSAELKLTLYADDNNAFAGSQQSIVHLFDELERFRLATGCTINKSKTRGLTLGGAPVPKLDGVTVLWNPPDGVKILGVTFFNDPMMTQSVTWREVTRKIRARAEILSSRKLSMRGRATIANSLLLSKAWHVATVVPATKKEIAIINMAVFNYIYENKTPHTIKEEALTLRVHQGGIGLLDLKLQGQALRLNRLQHILDVNNNKSWLIIPRLYTAQALHKYNTEWPFLEHVAQIDHEDPFMDSIATPPYLQELADLLRDNKQKYLDIKHPCTRTIYPLLLNKERATFTITGQQYWNETLGRALNWKRIWTRTYQSLHTSHHLDTFYKFLHNAHASGQRTDNSRGRYHRDCRRCNVFETPLHIFAECPFAYEVWNTYAHTLQTLHNRSLDLQEVLFPVRMPTDRHKARLILTLTNIIIHELWRARCAQHHERTPTDAATSTANINANIRRIHIAYGIHEPNFRQILCLPSPLCSATNDGQLRFTLPFARVADRDSDSSFSERSDSSVSSSSSSSSSE